MKRKIFSSHTLFLLALAWFAVFLSAGSGWSTRIVVFTPTSENNTYWPQVRKVLRAVAEDLRIDLDFYEFDVRDRFAKHIEGVKILNSTPKPDGAIFSVAFGNSEPLLNASEALNIPVFIQGPLFPSELPYIGSRPRDKFKTWVGYFFQDEFEKGYLLGKILLKKAHALGLGNELGEIRVAGIGGDYAWFGSKLRQDGLLKAVTEDRRASLAQVVPTRWSEKEAYAKTLLLLERHKELPVVWAASDQLGIGASEALREAGYVIGRTAVTGGLDLSRNGLEHVADGALTASVAASMLEYAKVLVYLFDYINGIDFADDVSTEIRASLHVATEENVDKFLRLLDRIEEIDYAVHSKFLNPSLERYNLSIDNLRYKKKAAE